jgi:hypothetical protein
MIEETLSTWGESCPGDILSTKISHGSDPSCGGDRRVPNRLFTPLTLNDIKSEPFKN